MLKVLNFLRFLNIIQIEIILISQFFQGKCIHSNDPSVVVRIDKDGVMQKLILSDEGIPKVDLPQVLPSVPGGIYTFENETYNCSIPGVYRFAKPQALEMLKEYLG